MENYKLDAIVGAGKTATNKTEKVHALVQPILRWIETDINRKLNKKGGLGCDVHLKGNKSVAARPLPWSWPGQDRLC